jgi:hypothetical protein
MASTVTTCPRPRCKTPGAPAVWTILLLGSLRVDVCTSCAADALDAGLATESKRDGALGVPAVAFRTAEGIICPDPTCLVRYNDLMGTATPMSDADIDAEQDQREGVSIRCECCGEALDRWTRRMGG